VDALCHQLYGLIVKNIVVTADNREFLQNLMDSKSSLINFFVDFFNNDTDFTMKRSLRYPGRDLFKNDYAKKYLICLDNAEALIDAKKDEFRALLKTLLSQCPHLQIMITSRKHLNKIDDAIETDLLFIPELKGDKPVQLFLHKAAKHKQLTIEEVVEIIQLDNSYPIVAFLKGKFADLESEQAKNKLKSLLRQHDKMIEALKLHDLFQQLAGNPLSITKLAACYASPLMKN